MTCMYWMFEVGGSRSSARTTSCSLVQWMPSVLLAHACTRLADHAPDSDAPPPSSLPCWSETRTNDSGLTSAGASGRKWTTGPVKVSDLPSGRFLLSYVGM